MKCLKQIIIINIFSTCLLLFSMYEHVLYIFDWLFWYGRHPIKYAKDTKGKFVMDNINLINNSCYNSLRSPNIWQNLLIRGHIQMNSRSANENTVDKILTAPFALSFSYHRKCKVLWLDDLFVIIHIRRFIRIWSLL